MQVDVEDTNVLTMYDDSDTGVGTIGLDVIDTGVVNIKIVYKNKMLP